MEPAMKPKDSARAEYKEASWSYREIIVSIESEEGIDSTMAHRIGKGIAEKIQQFRTSVVLALALDLAFLAGDPSH
jgi:hypothetical protein